jgi:hypothetical protein
MGVGCGRARLAHLNAKSTGLVKPPCCPWARQVERRAVRSHAPGTGIRRGNLFGRGMIGGVGQMGNRMTHLPKPVNFTGDPSYLIFISKLSTGHIICRLQYQLFVKSAHR